VNAQPQVRLNKKRLARKTAGKAVSHSKKTEPFDNLKDIADREQYIDSLKNELYNFKKSIFEEIRVSTSCTFEALLKHIFMQTIVYFNNSEHLPVVKKVKSILDSNQKNNTTRVIKNTMLDVNLGILTEVYQHSKENSIEAYVAYEMVSEYFMMLMEMFDFIQVHRGDADAILDEAYAKWEPFCKKMKGFNLY